MERVNRQPLKLVHLTKSGYYGYVIQNLILCPVMPRSIIAFIVITVRPTCSLQEMTSV